MRYTHATDAVLPLSPEEMKTLGELQRRNEIQQASRAFGLTLSRLNRACLRIGLDRESTAKLRKELHDAVDYYITQDYITQD